MHRETRVCRQGPDHTLLLSPDSTRGEKISLKFPPLSSYSESFNSLLPLVPGNNLRVSHWSAPPGSLGLSSNPYQVTSKVLDILTMPRWSQTGTTQLHFIQKLIFLFWEHKWRMLACISTKAATEHAHERRLRGTTNIQAAQEGRLV